MVFVLASIVGSAELKEMSTLTGTAPAAIGKLMASNVSEPTPNGRLQVFETDASPVQCNNRPMTPVIVRSKVAPVTSSLRSPVPVMLVFSPRVMDAGEKEVILVLVLGPPQSFQVNDNSFAATATSTVGLETCSELADALSISTQKRSSPFFAVALVMVFVLASIVGSAELKEMSTLTGTAPAAIGKLMASNVSEPTPNGRLQVFETDASPVQCNNRPMTPVIVRSKVAPVTSSLRSPLPVMVVFSPRVIDAGEKPVILVLVPAPPQSFQPNFKVPPWAPSWTATGLSSSSCLRLADALSISMQKRSSP